MFLKSRLLRLLYAALAAMIGVGTTIGIVGSVFASVPASGVEPGACINSVSVGIAPIIYEGTTPAVRTPTDLTARVADHIVYHVTVGTSLLDCHFHTGTVTITFPNGTKQTLQTSLSLTPGTSVEYTSSAYVVTNADIGHKTDTLLAFN